jgi:hypothetical protein
LRVTLKANSMGCFSGVMASARNVAEAALNYEDTIGASARATVHSRIGVRQLG